MTLKKSILLPVIIVFSLILSIAPQLSTGSDSTVVFVGKGEKYSSIQKAVQEARDNTIIKIRSGRYVFDDGVRINNKNNISLQGLGKVELLLTSPEFAVIIIDGSSNIKISNIHARHKIKPDASKVCSGAVIWLMNSSDITINKNELNGCGTIGVDMQSCGNVTISHNNIHHNNTAAISIRNSHGLKIYKNKIKDNAAPIIIGSKKIHTNDSTKEAEIKDNVFSNNG